MVTSCDYIEDIFGGSEDDEKSQENVDNNDSLEENVPYPTDLYSYDKYIKSIRLNPQVYGEGEWAEKVLQIVGRRANSTFTYDEYGRPSTVKHICDQLNDVDNLDRIETLYEFTYSMKGAKPTIKMLTKRMDFAPSGEIAYVYDVDTTDCTCTVAGLIDALKISYGRTINFTHIDNDRIWAIDDYVNGHKISYEMHYDNDGYLYNLMPGVPFPAINHINYIPASNVDYNVIHMGQIPFCYGYNSSLLLMLRMAGNFGKGLLDRHFMSTGSIGGLYYAAYPHDKAGQKVHELVYHVKYNLNGEGGEVVYVFDEEYKYVKTMDVHVPMTLCRVEYDAVVSEEPFDPYYPDYGCKVERIENEVETELQTYDMVFRYEFKYFDRSELK